MPQYYVPVSQPLAGTADEVSAQMAALQMGGYYTANNHGVAGVQLAATAMQSYPYAAYYGQLSEGQPTAVMLTNGNGQPGYMQQTWDGQQQQQQNRNEQPQPQQEQQQQYDQQPQPSFPIHVPYDPAIIAAGPSVIEPTESAHTNDAQPGTQTSQTESHMESSQLP